MLTRWCGAPVLLSSSLSSSVPFSFSLPAPLLPALRRLVPSSPHVFRGGAMELAWLVARGLQRAATIPPQRLTSPPAPPLPPLPPPTTTTTDLASLVFWRVLVLQPLVCMVVDLMVLSLPARNEKEEGKEEGVRARLHQWCVEMVACGTAVLGGGGGGGGGGASTSTGPLKPRRLAMSFSRVGEAFLCLLDACPSSGHAIPMERVATLPSCSALSSSPSPPRGEAPPRQGSLTALLWSLWMSWWRCWVPDGLVLQALSPRIFSSSSPLGMHDDGPLSSPQPQQEEEEEEEDEEAVAHPPPPPLISLPFSSLLPKEVVDLYQAIWCPLSSVVTHTVRVWASGRRRATPSLIIKQKEEEKTRTTTTTASPPPSSFLSFFSVAEEESNGTRKEMGSSSSSSSSTPRRSSMVVPWLNGLTPCFASPILTALSAATTPSASSSTASLLLVFHFFALTHVCCHTLRDGLFFPTDTTKKEEEAVRSRGTTVVDGWWVRAIFSPSLEEEEAEAEEEAFCHWYRRYWTGECRSFFLRVVHKVFSLHLLHFQTTVGSFVGVEKGEEGVALPSGAVGEAWQGWGRMTALSRALLGVSATGLPGGVDAHAWWDLFTTFGTVDEVLALVSAPPRPSTPPMTMGMPTENEEEGSVARSSSSSSSLAFIGPEPASPLQRETPSPPPLFPQGPPRVTPHWHASGQGYHFTEAEQKKILPALFSIALEYVGELPVKKKNPPPLRKKRNSFPKGSEAEGHERVEWGGDDVPMCREGEEEVGEWEASPLAFLQHSFLEAPALTRLLAWMAHQHTMTLSSDVVGCGSWRASREKTASLAVRVGVGEGGRPSRWPRWWWWWACGKGRSLAPTSTTLLPFGAGVATMGPPLFFSSSVEVVRSHTEEEEDRKGGDGLVPHYDTLRSSLLQPLMTALHVAFAGVPECAAEEEKKTAASTIYHDEKEANAKGNRSGWEGGQWRLEEEEETKMSRGKNDDWEKKSPEEKAWIMGEVTEVVRSYLFTCVVVVVAGAVHGTANEEEEEEKGRGRSGGGEAGDAIPSSAFGGDAFDAPARSSSPLSVLHLRAVLDELFHLSSSSSSSLWGPDAVRGSAPQATPSDNGDGHRHRQPSNLLSFLASFGPVGYQACRVALFQDRLLVQLFYLCTYALIQTLLFAYHQFSLSWRYTEQFTRCLRLSWPSGESSSPLSSSSPSAPPRPAISRLLARLWLHMLYDYAGVMLPIPSTPSSPPTTQAMAVWRSIRFALMPLCHDPSFFFSRAAPAFPSASSVFSRASCFDRRHRLFSDAVSASFSSPMTTVGKGHSPLLSRLPFMKSRKRLRHSPACRTAPRHPRAASPSSTRWSASSAWWSPALLEWCSFSASFCDACGGYTMVDLHLSACQQLLTITQHRFRFSSSSSSTSPLWLSLSFPSLPVGPALGRACVALSHLLQENKRQLHHGTLSSSSSAAMGTPTTTTTSTEVSERYRKKVEWWAARLALEEALQANVQQMEDVLCGGAKEDGGNQTTSKEEEEEEWGMGSRGSGSGGVAHVLLLLGGVSPRLSTALQEWGRLLTEEWVTAMTSPLPWTEAVVHEDGRNTHTEEKEAVHRMAAAAKGETEEEEEEEQGRRGFLATVHASLLLVLQGLPYVWWDPAKRTATPQKMKTQQHPHETEEEEAEPTQTTAPPHHPSSLPFSFSSSSSQAACVMQHGSSLSQQYSIPPLPWPRWPHGTPSRSTPLANGGPQRQPPPPAEAEEEAARLSSLLPHVLAAWKEGVRHLTCTSSFSSSSVSSSSSAFVLEKSFRMRFAQLIDDVRAFHIASSTTITTASPPLPSRSRDEGEEKSGGGGGGGGDVNPMPSTKKQQHSSSTAASRDVLYETLLTSLRFYLLHTLHSMAEESPLVRSLSSSLWDGEERYDLRRLPRTHVFLSIQSSCASFFGFPWEVLRVCRLHSMSRVPSGHYLVQKLWEEEENERRRKRVEREKVERWPSLSSEGPSFLTATVGVSSSLALLLRRPWVVVDRTATQVGPAFDAFVRGHPTRPTRARAAPNDRGGEGGAAPLRSSSRTGGRPCPPGGVLHYTDTLPDFLLDLTREYPFCHRVWATSSASSSSSALVWSLLHAGLPWEAVPRPIPTPPSPSFSVYVYVGHKGGEQVLSRAYLLDAVPSFGPPAEEEAEEKENGVSGRYGRDGKVACTTDEYASAKERDSSLRLEDDEGEGEKYPPSSSSSSSPVIFLMGCSSAVRIESRGERLRPPPQEEETNTKEAVVEAKKGVPNDVLSSLPTASLNAPPPPPPSSSSSPSDVRSFPFLGLPPPPTLEWPLHLEGGLPFSYLHARSASVIACLWDVTDADVDGLLLDLLGQPDGNEKKRQRARMKSPQTKEGHPITEKSDGTAKKEADGLSSRGVGRVGVPRAHTPLQQDSRVRSGETHLDSDAAHARLTSSPPRPESFAFMHSLRSIGEALARARVFCKLPMLTGAATILYGMNNSFLEAKEEVDG